VDEQIFSTAIGSDKAKALITVEPFDGSLCQISHFLIGRMSKTSGRSLHVGAY
jgi:hypothetical protein